MSVITEFELRQALCVLSELSVLDRLKWFKEQPEYFQQDVANLIRNKSIKFASSRLKVRHRNQMKSQMKDALQGSIAAMLTRVTTPTGEAVRLSIETEFGLLIAKVPRSDVHYLILFVEDGAIVAHSLNFSLSGCRDTINVKKHTYPEAIPYKYKLVIKYDHEQTLSAR